jgi:hypothetical protein
MMKKQLGLLLLSVCLLGTVFARYGGQPGAFLSYAASARSVGLGRAFVAVANDSSASYFNPAGLVQVPSIEGSFFQSDLYGEYSLTSFNFVYPMVDNYLGFTYTGLNSNAMNGRDQYNVETESFTDSKTALSLSFAQAIFIPGLSFGTSAKYVSRKLESHADSRILGDIGFLYRPLSFLSVGATIQNIIDLQLNGESADQFSPLIRAGVAAKDKDIQLSFDIENDLTNWFFGVEYMFHPLIILRGGLNYESLNFGFSSELSGIRFDYAYSNDKLGSNNRFSVNLGIGQIIDDFQRTAAVDWVDMSQLKYKAGFFLLALNDMKKAYILDPTDKEIIARLGKLKKLEKLSKKLNLDIEQEKALWPRYKEVLDFIEKKQLDQAMSKVKQLKADNPSNPNVIQLYKEVVELVKKSEQSGETNNNEESE